MNLLHFDMPPSLRIQFVSQAAKEVWEPKIERAREFFRQIERQTVIHGLRKCTTKHVPSRELVNAIQQHASEGLTLVPIQAVGSYSGFAHSHPPVVEGRPWGWFCSVSKSPEDAHAFRIAHDESDHLTMGRLLGYPDCCKEFFRSVWVSGYHDPIWQQAENCSEELIKNRREQFIRLRKETPWQTSSMLRYIGVRILPHVTCAHDCKGTKKMADEWLVLAEELGLPGFEETKELLQMPVEWNASHGIAYITTPIFKIEVNSVTCDSPYVVQVEGTFRPSEGAKGLKFPFL